MLKHILSSYTVRALIALGCYVLIQGCAEKISQLEEIRQQGVLHVVTRAGPTTYYRDDDGENGLEYRLAGLFASRLGVDVELTVAGSTAEIIARLASGKADIAAAGLIKTADQDETLDYGPGYQWVTKQVMYRNGYKRPASLDDIHPGRLHLARDTLIWAELERLQTRYPSLVPVMHQDKTHLDLLGMIEDGEILYAAAWSSDLAYGRVLNPEVRGAFDLTPPRPMGWAVRRTPGDDSLIREIRQFFGDINNDGQLAELVGQVYNNNESFDYVDSRKFIDRYNRRLPGLKSYFRSAAAEFGFDWRLLAAISYQESHWLKQARSPTGVRGLMMLTQKTAEQLGVDNRLDPEQSIHGGAKYLTTLMDRVPDRIADPDRTWLALAAYNVGFSHLEDARVLTQRNGRNPDTWSDVKNGLPLLSKMKWYEQTKHGYARGYEPVKFVENIRKYYAVLQRLTYEETEPIGQLAEHGIIESSAL